MIRTLDDLRALEAFFDRSEVLWVAVLTLDGAIVTASASLEYVAGGPLSGRRFAELICAPQRPAFVKISSSAGADWTTATLAMGPSGTTSVSDRVIHVRRSDASLMVIAEPADRHHEQRLTQLFAINDALIATQRKLAERQRELEQTRDETARVLRRLETLERITITAIEDESPEAGMRTLLEQGRELVGGQRSSLLLLDAGKQHLTMVHHLGARADQVTGWAQPVGVGVAGACVSLGQAIVVEDVRRDQRIGVPERSPSRSLVVVPLRVRGEVVGVLFVGADERAAFNNDHAVMLQAVGDRAAAVLAHTQNVRRERRIAETFQRSMLPHSLPQGALELVAHYQPQARGSAVGGDWYDAIAFADGQVGLCIGDVAGKGLDAAVTMGQVRSAMHALALGDREPGELLRRLDLFVSSLETMVTVLYVLVDPATGTMTYASAGHLPPLRRAPGGAVDVLEVALSPPLGIDPWPGPRPQATSTLEHGAQLVLYTDGLIERRGEDLMTSLQSLAARCADPRVQPGELAAHLLGTTNTGPREFDDDVAVLTAHWSRDAGQSLPRQPLR